MARGFLSGAMMGTVVSLGVAGIASTVADGPKAPNVSDAAPSGVSIDAGTGQAGVDASTADADLVQGSSNAVSELTPDDVNAVAQAGSDLSQQPETGGTEGLNSPDAGSDEGAVDVDSEAPVLPSPQAAIPATPDSEAELSISTDPAQPPAPEVSVEETAFEETPVVVEPEPEPEPEPEAPVVNNEENALPQPSDIAQDDSSPKIGRAAGSLVDRADAPATVEVATDTPVAATATIPPVKAFAVPFENAGDKPLMSIVLIDAGVDLDGAAVGLPALRSFPAPITFAVDASLPDAVARMKEYRREGFEVLAMVDLPSGATATDAEVTLGAVLSQMAEVVGVLEGVGVGLQETREASDQATQILLASGHGFVTQSKGLNTVAKLAEREGVPTATVFRDFDSADQSPIVIRRFLDQAAFRAGQEGGVIMLGRLRSDTISALLLWGLADRASRVNLAPVSAILSK